MRQSTKSMALRLGPALLALAACRVAAPEARNRPPSSGYVRIDHARFVAPDGRDFYVHGVNLPWLDGHYGSYLAPSFVHPEWGTQYRHETMRERLAQIRSLHANVVRLFLFNDLQGFRTDHDGNITGVDPIFFEHLDDTVALASSLGLKLYLVVLDGVREHPELAVEREMFLTPARRRQLEDVVIKPLARRYKGNAAVFAFDVLNESNHEVEGPIGWDQLRALVRDTAAAIHAEDPERLVSCSLIKANAKSLSLLQARYADLGLDFFDLHQYADDPDLPNISATGLKKPVILGEFGQGEGGGEDRQAVAAASFLEQARERGWAGALIWAFDFPGSPKEHRLMNADGSWRDAATVLRQFGEASERQTTR